MRPSAFATALAALPTIAFAQNVVHETPHSQELTVPIGGVVWEKTGFNGTPGVIIQAPVIASFRFSQVVSLPAESPLMIIREKKLKACRERTTTSLGGYSFGGWTDCLVDTDGDGRFDRVSVNEVAGGKDIVPPVAYTREQVPVAGSDGVSFKQTLTYLGVSDGSIRLSYREFANDLARAAFTEDLTLPAPKSFPQTMMVKTVKLTIVRIGSDGLTYQID